MQRFYDGLDKALTWVLVALVVAMVFSISSEIVLNAAVQPAASHLIRTLGHEGGGEPEGNAEAASEGVSKKASMRRVRVLEAVANFVAKASAPVNTASQTLLVWIGILGSALAFRMRAHLGVDALVRVYPRRVRLVLDHISTALVGLFSAVVLVIGGYMVCYRAFSLGSKMPGFEMVNRGWFYLVLVITGVLNLAYCLYHFLHPKPVEGLRPEPEEQGNP